MKLSIWDLLAIILIAGILLILVVTGSIFNNPNSAFNPFPPATEVPTINVPTFTPTPLILPATWTPAAGLEPTLAETSTLAPSATPFPTRTPFVLPSPTKVPTLVPRPTNDRLPLVGDCKVIKQDPADGTSFKPGTEFTTLWTLQNTGTAMWDRGSVDLKFVAGEGMYKNVAAADMPVSVDPGKSVDITVTMIAPETAGYHISYWSLLAGSKTLCSFYVEILVEK